MTNKGLKNDFVDGKLRWDLLPLEEIEDIVKVYTFGANKYSDNSWQHLDNGYDRYKAALLRHLTAIDNGEIVDVESGLPHTAHIMWNAIALNYFLKKGDKIIYKDIPGYERYYYADNLGNIYSKDRIHNTSSGGFLKKGRKLKPAKNNKGYLNVVLCNGNTQRTFRVHQLIARTFLDNPDGYTEVNHKDENKSNNNVLNLEWCTREHNMNWGTLRKRLSENSKSRNYARPIQCLNSDYELVKEYKAISDVKEDDFDPSFVAKACKGIKDKAYNYYWRYK